MFYPPKRISMVLSVLSVAIGTGAVQASVQVVGGSNLLTSEYEEQLDIWLNQGSITLTNIFDHEPGDGKTSYDFHAAADGKGPTITLIQVLENSSGVHWDASTNSYSSYSIGEQLIGGYNPQSWDSDAYYHYTPDDDDRTAFLFNLTNSVKQDQKLSTSAYGSWGEYQTYNWSGYGPIFGGGHDLWVNGSLTSGYAYSLSYGNGYGYGPNPDDILIEFFPNDESGDVSYAEALYYGHIEVFAITPLAESAPEPTSFVAWSLLALVVGASRTSRSREPSLIHRPRSST